MRRVVLPIFLAVFLVSAAARAQETKDIYDPSISGLKQFNTAVKEARTSGKHVLVQVGGNWCSWCRKLHKLTSTDTTIAAALRDDYVVVYMNYSKENKNMDVMNLLGHPERFGFPVLVVVDGKGNRLHTQDSGLLESGEGHDPEKVLRFLKLWTVEAVKTGKYPGEGK